MKKENFIFRIFLSILGLFVIGIGVSFMIKSNLGADPASTLQLGISKVLGVSYGTGSLLYNLVILGIVFVIDKKYINVSSVLAMFIIGYTVDFILFLITGIDVVSFPIYLRIIILIIGAFICSFGVTLYIFADLGVGATDCVAEIISDKLNKPYKMVRMLSDLIFVILGYLLGGAVGIGTILLAFIIGPFIQISRKILHFILKEQHLDDNLTEVDFEKDLII